MTRIQNGLAQRFASGRGGNDMPSNFGRVIATDPTQNRVDIVLYKGGILRGVPVLRETIGTHEGSSYLPKIDNPPSATQTDLGPSVLDMRSSKTNDTFALVDYIMGDMTKPYILGFLPPESFEASFSDAMNVEVEKHRNGMYTNFTSDGLEISHPSGTYIRIGVGTTKTNLNALNYDAARVPFSDTSGTATATPDITISHNSGTSVRITTAGSIIITKAGGGSFALETHTHSDPQGGSTGGPV